MKEYTRRSIWSWALYDWANSAFATTVMAGFFPVFFTDYWDAGSDSTISIFRLGNANSLASLIIVLAAPVLGAIADRGAKKKRLLFSFAALGVITTGALSLVAQGSWQLALVLYALGTIGYSGANSFYDSLLVSVAPRERLDIVSALGFALGYLGGGLLFGLNVLMSLYPAWFGLADTAQAVKLSFITVAVWWAVFSIPILLFVDEPGVVEPRSGWAAVKAGFHQLRKTFSQVRKLRVVFLFLVGYWFYIDGVDTIVRMAAAYGRSIGFATQDLVTALLIVQFVAFPAAIAFGRIGQRIGPRRAIFICLAVYIAITVWAFFMDHVIEFYGLAIAVGLVQGGIQSLSRSLFARLIPESQAAEFFGFYNMLGKFAAVIGPSMMGFVGVWTGRARLSILSIVTLFLVGAVLLYFVDEKAGVRAAKELEVL